MSKKVLHSKFGNVSIYSGYYHITSKKEGNYGKLFHRLIFEDFYGFKIPEGYVIHHKNGNKLDNCILNLQMMRHSDHISHHMSGKNHPLYGTKLSEETKRKISDSIKGEKHPWYGRHHTEETKKKISDAHKGKIIPEDEKERLRNLCKGRKHSEETKQRIREKLKAHHRTEEHCINISKAKNKTGYYNVSISKNKCVKQGWGYRYQYYDENGKKQSLFSVDIKKLEEKVKSKGYKWIKY